MHNQLSIELPHLARLLSRSKCLENTTDAQVTIRGHFVELAIETYLSENCSKVPLRLSVRRLSYDWQISAMAQVCASIQYTFLSVKTLNISGRAQIASSGPFPQTPEPDWDDAPEPEQWLELLQPFGSVKELTVDGLFVDEIVRALRMLPSMEGVLSVMPELRQLELKSGSYELAPPDRRGGLNGW
ncbi:hypothetical protein BC834DRAFT_842440 [Gloeopeniophorella convolvens]|nr:hypothetical protein BC834DRAFT_848339 [Gloeopeniophorella convolvens]KAI0267760.1 hypothetical protein BC834DRAFT_842440 [Gloeopeniophorella convolvens]